MQKTFTFLFTAFMLVCASCKKADVATPVPVVTPAPPAPPAVIYDSIFIANTIAGGNKEYAYYQVKPNSTATSSSGTSGGFQKGCISLDNKYRYQLANNGTGGYFIYKYNYGGSSIGLFSIGTTPLVFQAWEMVSIAGTNKLVLDCSARLDNVTINSDDLFVCNDNGTGLTKITNYTTSGSQTQTFIDELAVNNIGTRLVFKKQIQIWPSGGVADLVAVNIDGTNEQIVLPGTLGNFNKFISPCFSKDNTKIYYANSNNEIRSVNVNGTGDALVFTIVGLPIKKLSLNKAGTHFFIAQSSTTAYTVKQIDINGNNEILIRNSGVAFVDFLVKN
jgi:hypothetical protein